MSNSDIILGEVLGTAVLILLGAGVCAAVTLKKSKAQNAGWLAIAFGWGFAVLTAAYISAGISGAHLNPAVTLGLAVQGNVPWDQVPLYIASQMVGALLGAILAWAAYYGQFQAHMADVANQPEAVEGPEDAKAGPVLGIFSTGPEVRNAAQNLVTEIIATFVLVFAILTQGLNDAGNGLGTLGVLITALVVVSIGLSLGGPTGYAINPARDLGPRIAHAILPIKGKGRSDWGYAWIPVVGPVVGGVLAGLLYNVALG
ncbi:MIP/aquaporin family protein [Glycomyces algeriensis]|uniref:Glycerol uptake facilitator protein n=1 Tax=Glycomyces algeriensis TaxID=256037 RepID=A0A9W6GBM3_9ACTN|nr:MIP/aquaporin family protein [Glycomyces algeriensis]MDA1365453.1 aquaporin family protein [Glycomyces algeriensis]MDR7351139.1 glycerol uptake facilitator protein [Glycomyces algeriensis]GLI43852.1 putative glycerol uptake facilitator protein [Glycomyces algeriensis]